VIHPDPQGRYLSTRFSTALLRAAELHATQRRKKDDRDIPYVTHLLSVAALVLEDSGSEDEAIAGLFHDAIEDQGLTAARLSDEFGPEVARIVMACSDAVAEPGGAKPEWLPRKITHVAHLEKADAAILRVTAADKLHNCLDIVADVERDGIATLDRFNGKAQGTCWYYGAMAQLLMSQLPGSGLPAKLAKAARTLHTQAGYPFPAPLPETIP
jgi:(p)ppGpp synthase/HD superfamily hydrolase